MFEHGTEKTVNVIVSKVEDGKTKKEIHELWSVAIGMHKYVRKIAGLSGLCFIAAAVAFYIQDKQLKELDERVTELEDNKTAEENQEN